MKSVCQIQGKVITTRHDIVICYSLSNISINKLQDFAHASGLYCLYTIWHPTAYMLYYALLH